MKLLAILLLFFSYSAFSNVDVNVELNLNEKSVIIQSKNVAFEKEKTLNQNDLKIIYKVSKKIPKEIPADYNNQKSILLDVLILRDKKVLGTGQLITLYGKEATLETTNEHGLFKVKFVANETFNEKNKRISAIKRLPVYTESTFPVSYRPIEDVKSELEKLISKKGKISIDANTNSLIVKDTLERMIEINKKFNSIDI
jgi:type II secretory pathway component HofQ